MCQNRVDWKNVKVDMVRQILHQGEIKLQAQLQMALAADNRATNMANAFITLAAAVIGTTIAYIYQFTAVRQLIE